MNTTSQHPPSDGRDVNSPGNGAQSKSVEALSARRWPPTHLPSELQNLESQIESIFRYSDRGEDDAQDQSTIARRQEIIVWLLIALLVLLSVLAFYLLYLKATGACWPSSSHCTSFANGLGATGVGRQ